MSQILNLLPFLVEHSTLMIRVLTVISLSGLLFTVGMRLNLKTVMASLKTARLSVILPLNFLLIPWLALTIAQYADLSKEASIALVLLASAPFAPVVPLFVSMSRGHLALAAGLTAVFPVFSMVFTPLVTEVALWALYEPEQAAIHPLKILFLLFFTITFPMLLGMGFSHLSKVLSLVLLRPLEVFSETVGALSLVFLIYLQWDAIAATSLGHLCALFLFGEGAFLLGYSLGDSGPGHRQVMGFGALNRNIGLSVLIAVTAYAETPVVGALVTNSLLLIVLGLFHVAIFRWWPSQVRIAKQSL